MDIVGGCLLVVLAVPLLLVVLAMLISAPLPTLIVLALAAWPSVVLYRRMVRPLAKLRLSPAGHRFRGGSTPNVCGVCGQPRLHHGKPA